MVLKTAIIVVSMVTIVLASAVAAGAIYVAQMLESDPSVRSEIRRWLEPGEVSGQDSQDERSLSSPQSLQPAMQERKVVSIVGNSGANSYNPNPIETRVGDTVIWINNDSSPHTATSSSSPLSTDSSFDSSILRRGETFSFTFDKEGQYPYFCALHPSMIGTVVVVLPTEE
jgi:plastocyanin